jgi:predicted amidophosphoribosyltransferase
VLALQLVGLPQTLLSSFIYDEVLSKIILAAKEENSRSAQFFLAKNFSALLLRAAKTLERQSLSVITVPSTPSAIAKRGYVHLDRVMRFVPAMSAISFESIITLKSRKGVRDQSEVGHSQRTENVQGSFSIRGGSLAKVKLGAGIILVDDVVTTGSSMRESIRALNMAGIEPDMLISACISPRLASNRMVPS